MYAFAMKSASVMTFALHALVAICSGVVVGTSILLIWLDVYENLLRHNPIGGWGRIMVLPFALPIAAAFAFPIAILPTLLLGGGLSYVFKRTGLVRPLFRVIIGGLVGGVIGFLMMLRVEQGAIPGIIFGASIGGAWFFVERFRASGVK